MIGRIAMQELLPIRCVWVAIFSHPACSCKKLVVPLHVEEWHGAHHGAPQFGTTHKHVGDKQATIGSAPDSKLFRGGDMRSDEVLRYLPAKGMG